MVQAAVPGEINFQGRLTNDAGTPLEGVLAITFRLYEQESGGSEVWNEAVDTALVDGYFSERLGANNPLTTAIMSGSAELWLEMSIGGETLSPRYKLGSAPYVLLADEALLAGQASDADTLDSLDSLDFALVAHNHDAAYVNVGEANSITSAMIVDSTISSADIAANTITAADIADGTVGTNEITNGTITLTDLNLTSVDGRYVNVTGDSMTGVLTVETAPYADWMVKGSSTYAAGYTPTMGYLCCLDLPNDFEGIASADFSGWEVGVLGLSHGTAASDNYGVLGHSNETGVGGYGNVNDFYAYGPGTNYASSSSARWKTAVTVIENALDKVLRMRGVYFQWDEEHGGHHDMGMIAEEVGEVLPEIVVFEENGEDAIGMDYSKLTPVLVEAVKKLKAENDALKKRVEALEASRSTDWLKHTSLPVE